jgi:hypothetical protein
MVQQDRATDAAIREGEVRESDPWRETGVTDTSRERFAGLPWLIYTSHSPLTMIRPITETGAAKFHAQAHFPT